MAKSMRIAFTNGGIVPKGVLAKPEAKDKQVAPHEPVSVDEAYGQSLIDDRLAYEYDPKAVPKSTANTAADAEARAFEIIKAAKDKADQIVADAGDKAKKIVVEAEAKAKTVADDADAKAGETIKVAEDKAKELIAEAEAKVTEITKAAGEKAGEGASETGKA